MSAARAFLTPLLRAPLTSYIAILLLQLKVVWGMWWYKDLTAGDDSNYFLRAWNWFESGRSSFAWSPLYTYLYGLLFRFSSDAYVLSIAQRLIIDFVLAVLVLALMRHLLPAGVAWMAAAWWVVLPVDFNSLYEVHLFAVIPLLLGVLCALWKPGPWGRGMATACFLIAGVLMRQEYLPAMLCMAAVGIGWDAVQSASGKLRVRTLAGAYGLPLVAAFVMIGVFFEHSFPLDVALEMRAKNAMNTCQLYAFDYQQRAADLPGNPWTSCKPLMNRVFGSSDVTVPQALLRNPRAMLEHVAWNIREMPAGLQIALFNVRWGGANPDYRESPISPLIWIPSLALMALLIYGLPLGIRGANLIPLTSEGVTWGWVALLCASGGAMTAILMANARPATLFILAIGVRAAVGLAVCGVIRRWPRMMLPGSAAAILLVGAALLLPRVYQPGPSPRPLMQAYRRLTPFRDLFRGPNVSLVATESDVVQFAGYCRCPSVRFDELRAGMKPGEALGDALNRRGATIFLTDERTIGDGALRDFLANPGAYRWQKIAGGVSGDWALFHTAR